MHKYNSRVTALKEGCNFKFKVNEITLVIGPNGSGKSTLFKAIS